MTTANVHQAKTNLSKLLNAAAEGEEVIITRRGGKVTRFKLTPVELHPKPPLFGALKGQITPLSDEEWAASDKAVRELFEDSLNTDER